ncbi:MAG: DNA polymerase III subunit epsilon [Alphaproteobacteria bacterium]
MREIILDTETTGLDPAKGDRLVEVAALEVVNCIPTGAFFHSYVNPQRDVPSEAVKVHGLTNDFLKDFPVFEKITEPFLSFIQDSQLVIHNSDFDLKFINFELKTISVETLKNPIVDTLKLARSMFPGSPASLDALCRRFKIDSSNRTYHGALIDCELLSEVYLELRGGRQRGLSIAHSVATCDKKVETISFADISMCYKNRPFRTPRNFSISDQEKEGHLQMIKSKLSN